MTIDFTDQQYSRPIRQLERTLINKIAAGEVIERPASVIKETTENAFDAGAIAVDVVARKAGTTYMSVTDNGCGIPADQVRLAFQRHATSKIGRLEDLFSVYSFGFRGEALPSIASVSHLTLTTRSFREEIGTRIVIEGGREIELAPVAAAVGTRVEVAHLFFNTPARRKFFRTETTESRQIIRVVERMALSRPSAAVSLNLNDRETIKLPPNQPAAERMAALFGVEAGGIVEYDVELSGISYLVYLGHPDQARQDRSRICLFINGRPVTSSSIIHAVTAGYGEFLAAGRYPLAAVYVTLDPQQLDVNVHPTKAEVRLSDERAIHDNVYRIVNKALRDWRLTPGSSSSKPLPGVSDKEPGHRREMAFPDSGPRTKVSFSTKPPARYSPTGAPTAAFDMRPHFEEKIVPAGCDPQSSPARSAVAAEKRLDAIPAASDMEYLGRIESLYLLILIRGELYIFDQHAVHERVLYEQALEQMESGKASTQRLLFPETVGLSGGEFLVFESSREILACLGFEVEPFGVNTVIINGVPPVFGDGNPEQILRKMLDDIGEMNKAGGELRKIIAQSLACRAAVMAGDRMIPEEVIPLLTALFSTNNPFCCPHGRPTHIKIKREELDGRFGR